MQKRLQCSIIVVSDFKSHHPVWGWETSDVVGRNIVNFLEANQRAILNDDTQIRINPVRKGYYTAIDLGFTTLDLAGSSWEFIKDTTSDHLSVVMTTRAKQLKKKKTLITNHLSISWKVSGEISNIPTLKVPAVAISDKVKSAPLDRYFYEASSNAHKCKREKGSKQFLKTTKTHFKMKPNIIM